MSVGNVCDCVVGMGYDGLGGCPDEVKRSMLPDWDEADIAFDSFCRNCGRNLKPERDALQWGEGAFETCVTRCGRWSYEIIDGMYALTHMGRFIAYLSCLGATKRISELIHQTECGAEE